MSGVIDESGKQWEHCNRCTKWVDINLLHYQKPNLEFPYGRDLCPKCAKVVLAEGFKVIA